MVWRPTKKDDGAYYRPSHHAAQPPVRFHLATVIFSMIRLAFLLLPVFLSAQSFHFAVAAPEGPVRRQAPFGAELRMDVYQPTAVSGSAFPAIIFFKGGDASQRTSDFYFAWAPAAAANGFVAVNAE